KMTTKYPEITYSIAKHKELPFGKEIESSESSPLYNLFHN
ncbi:3789_t:CDS:1, partial [Dentiscutata erythropus]